MSRSHTFTPLLPTLLSLLSPQSSPEQLENATIRRPIVLAAMFIKNDIAYLTDLAHSIQMYMEFKMENKTMTGPRLSPNNSLESKYYRIIGHQWQPLNCHKKYLNPPTREPLHPYLPQFYFGSDYSGLIQEKNSNGRYMVDMKVIQIKEWRVRLVNVSGTGYYAPTIQPLRQQTLITQASFRAQSLSCVVYQPEVQAIMELMRLNDWRKESAGLIPSRQQTSFLYHNLLAPSRQHRPNVRVLSVDKQGKILKCDYSPNHCKFVLTSLLDKLGVFTLQTPVHSERIDKRRIMATTLTDIKALLPSVPTTGKGSSKKSKRRRLWDSDSESEAPVVEIIVDEDEEEESEEEDPLRRLYQKQMCHARAL